MRIDRRLVKHKKLLHVIFVGIEYKIIQTHISGDAEVSSTYWDWMAYSRHVNRSLKKDKQQVGNITKEKLCK